MYTTLYLIVFFAITKPPRENMELSSSTMKRKFQIRYFATFAIIISFNH